MNLLLLTEDQFEKHILFSDRGSLGEESIEDQLEENILSSARGSEERIFLLLTVGQRKRFFSLLSEDQQK